MARFLPGSIAADIRGKLGGTIFQRSSTGLIIKAHATPVNRNTLFQSVARNYTFYLSQAWTSLLDSQRSAWSAWSEYQSNQSGFFSRVRMTGQNAFFQANYYRLLAGYTLQSDPVFTPFNTDYSGLALVSLYGSGAYIQHPNYGSTETAHCICLFSGPMRSSRNCKPSLAFVARSGRSGYDYDIYTTSYYNRFGHTLVLNDQVWISIVTIQIDNSTLSAVVSKKFTLVAG